MRTRSLIRTDFLNLAVPPPAVRTFDAAEGCRVFSH